MYSPVQTFLNALKLSFLSNPACLFCPVNLDILFYIYVNIRLILKKFVYSSFLYLVFQINY